MSYQLNVNNISVAVTPKDIKNLHLAVYPPDGEVRVSAPHWMNENRIRYYVLSKMAWIKKQQNNFLAQSRADAPEFLNMETHYVWAQPCLLQIHPDSSKNGIVLDYNILNIFLKGDASKDKMDALLQSWYRQLVAEEGSRRIDYWISVFNLAPVNLYVRHMKTRWGSCAPLKNKILLNTELAKKPRECLDYVVAHELAHFFVPNHGEKFTRFMDKYLPNWKNTRQLLNSLPLCK